VGVFPVGLSDESFDVSGFKRKNFCDLYFNNMVTADLFVVVVYDYCVL
jgi:hypothetical protein